MPYVILFIVLCGIWVIFSGLFTPFLLVMGVISCALAVWVTCRIDQYGSEHYSPPAMQSIPLFIHPKMLLYIMWLAKEIFKSSLSVAKMVWQVEPDIKPMLACVPTAQTNDVGRTIFATSITLTPGTVTVFADETRMLVHALHRNGIFELKEGLMDGAVAWVAGKR